jgi:hypothetical protein
MFIGPGRPGEIKPPGHPFFGSAKEVKTRLTAISPSPAAKRQNASTNNSFTDVGTRK